MAEYKDIEQRTETQQTPVVANQQEYINKQALLDELEKISFGKHGQLERAVAERVFLAIDRMPAADVVPREEVEYLKKENRYLRDRLAEEMEHAKDMKGIDDIVRCKNCIFCKHNSSALTYRCDRRGYYPEEVKESGFCSYGRRTDDEV